MNEKPLCIYHGNCMDGFTAAWVVRRYYHAWHGPDSVEFFPGVYQQDPPKVAGRQVILVDFSYKRAVMEKIIKAAKGVLIIDHHASAERDLDGLDTKHPTKVKLRFDMSHSGAMLTWLHFFPALRPPRLLEYVEDRDLWKFELPDSREVAACVFSWPYKFEVWDMLFRAKVEELVVDGKAIERKYHKDVAELVEAFKVRKKIGGHMVPVSNLPYTYTSDAGHMMAAGEPFAACYWDTPAGRVFSLRSQDGGIDVSKIAEEYGGGGHKHAAGFTIPWATKSKKLKEMLP